MNKKRKVHVWSFWKESLPAREYPEFRKSTELSDSSGSQLIYCYNSKLLQWRVSYSEELSLCSWRQLRPRPLYNTALVVTSEVLPGEKVVHVGWRFCDKAVLFSLSTDLTWIWGTPVQTRHSELSSALINFSLRARTMLLSVSVRSIVDRRRGTPVCSSDVKTPWLVHLAPKCTLP